MTASPNFDPKKDELIKQINDLIGDLDQNPKEKWDALDINARIGKIQDSIQKLGNQLNSEFKQSIQKFEDKLIEVNRLDPEIQKIQLVSWRNFGDLSRDVQHILSFLSPKELLANQKVSKGFGKIAIEVAIKKINKDRVPLHDLGLNLSELRDFIQKFGEKIEYLNFDGILRYFDNQGNLFQYFSFEEISKCCPNLKGLSLVNCAVTTDQIRKISSIKSLNLKVLRIYNDPRYNRTVYSMGSRSDADIRCDNKIDGDAILLLGEGSFRNLEELDISIEDPYLKELDISIEDPSIYYRKRDQEKDNLHAAITTNLATVLGSLNQLQKLRIRGLFWRRLDQETFKIFCTALRNMVKLEQLNLNGLRFDFDESGHSSGIFFDAIKSLVNLKSLSLRDYPIDKNTEIDEITDVLGNLKSLEFFDFSENMVFRTTEPDAQHVARFINALGELPLKKCMLDSNKLNDKVIVNSLAKLILNFSKLTDKTFLGLYNSLSRDSLLQLADLLKSSKDQPNFKLFTLDIGPAFTRYLSKQVYNDLIAFGEVFKDAESIFVVGARPEAVREVLREVNVSIYGADRDGAPLKQLFLNARNYII